MVNVNPDTSPPNGFRQKMISTTITVMMMMVWSRCGGCCGSDDDNADNGEVYGSVLQGSKFIIFGKVLNTWHETDEGVENKNKTAKSVNVLLQA